MNMYRTLLFEEKRRKKARTIYEWAVENQKELGCAAEPIRINFESDHLVQNSDNCIVSIFHDEESGNTLMRRDWPKQMAVKFNVILNYDEIKTKAPNSVQHMTKNGKMLYEYYNASFAEKQRLNKARKVPFYCYDE